MPEERWSRLVDAFGKVDRDELKCWCLDKGRDDVTETNQALHDKRGNLLKVPTSLN